MDRIKGFSLDLEKVSQDFAKLTPPEFSSNIVLRFIHCNVSSPFPITIFILLVCSKFFFFFFLRKFKILYLAILDLDDVIP